MVYSVTTLFRGENIKFCLKISFNATLVLGKIFINKVIPFILLIFKNYNGYKMPLRITAFLWIRIRRNLTDPTGALQILVYTQILLNWTIF